MVYVLELGHWGFCGDSYSLISTQPLAAFATREEAWAALAAVSLQAGVSPVEYLIRKPQWGPNADGASSAWDDPPDLSAYRRLFEAWGEIHAR